MYQQFDLRDVQGGYSGGKAYQDEDIYVAICRETAHKSTRIVIDVTFYKLGIQVLTFDFYDLVLVLRKDATKKQEFVSAVLNLVKFDYDTLAKMVESSHKEGFREGQAELQSNLQKLLGVEG